MIQVFINDEEVVSDATLEITEEALATSSTILKNCYPKSWEDTHDYVNNFYFPKDYSRCTIYQNNNLIFSGAVKNTGNISLNPRDPHYVDLQILDFKTLLSEGDTLDFVIADKTIQEAIEMVVNAVSSYGFVLGNVEILNPNEIIGAYSTQNKTAYDVFQYLSEISQSQWTTRVIDENTVAIDFYDPTLMPRAMNINYTDEFFCENNINDIKFNYSTSDYRNKQIMMSDQVYGSTEQTQRIVANGYQDEFIAELPIGEIISITTNGVESSFTTKTNQELGYSAEYYYTPGDNIITSEETPSAGTIIIISYIPIVQGREIINNTQEETRIQGQINRRGVIARYETRNDVTSSSELIAVGESYIKYKGAPEITLTITTNDKDLFNIGDVTTFQNAPMTELQLEYMVKKKTTTMYLNAGHVFYSYELSSSFNTESAINYFDNQRNKAKGNLKEGDSVLRNIDIENTGNIIFYDVEIQEGGTISDDNILNAKLNAPLIK